MIRWCATALFLVLIQSEKVLSGTKPKDEKNYRLPKTAKPLLYDIAVTVEPDFYTTKKFKGHVKMSVDILQETTTVVMHSANITYENSTKYKIKFDEEVQKMTLTFDAPLKVGSHDFEFNYQGVLHEDMNGFYLSYYIDETTKQKQWIATTQLQATYARRAFPCFDEPEFKAKYKISVTRPLDYNSLSNTVLNYSKNSTNSATDVYATTPKMSSYLVAIIVSKFKGYGQTKNLGNKQYDVYCTESTMKTAGHAYEIGPKLIDRLSKFTDINYFKAGIPKLYQVAIPDFSAGAMENWGLVTFRESDLLFDEDESPAYDKSKIAIVIAHEFSHMWFGDMVTTEWWSSTWLNEGFAEYFCYLITDEVEETWETMKQFVVRNMQKIFETDALTGAFALTSNVSSPEEVADKFDDLSYSKGAAIVRMMHFIMRDKPFLNGIRDYLKNNMYNNTTPSDVWKAFSQYANKSRLPEATTFGTVMSTWTEQSGFPLVYAFVNGNDVVLSQKRFLFNRTVTTDNRKWYIPITYTTSQNTNFSSDNINWLTPDNKTYTLDEVLKGKNDWIILNLKQYGFYRVQYDSNLWERIVRVFKSDDFTTVDPINRAEIIDDMFNLAKAGLVKFGRILDMTLYLEKETDFYPWRSAFRGFEYLRIRTGVNKKLLQHITNVMIKLYDTVTFNVTKATPYMQLLKTEKTLQFACLVENEHCLSNSAALFEEYKKGKYINPNIRDTVYCYGILQSHTSDNWNFLWKKYLNTTLATEKTTMLSSLACTKDRKILLDYLKKSITKDSGIRKQDANLVFESVASTTATGFQVAYKFFKDNIREISEYYAGMGALSSAIRTIANYITTKGQLQDFEKFLKTHPKALKEASKQIDNALETARANLNWPKDDVLNWLDANYSSAIKSKGTIIAVVLALVCTINNIM